MEAILYLYSISNAQLQSFKVMQKREIQFTVNKRTLLTKFSIKLMMLKKIFNLNRRNKKVIHKCTTTLITFMYWNIS